MKREAGWSNPGAWVRLVWVALLLGLSMAAPAWAASSATGVWSYSAGGYLALVEITGSGTVVALQVNEGMTSGKAYVGTRSGDAISAKSPNGGETLNLTLSGSTYSGNVTTGSGSSAVSGQLLLAYQGSEYDGVWQQASTSRYLVNLTVSLGGVSTMVLLDVQLSGTSTAVTYDIATGTVSTSGSAPTFVGKSLISGNTVSLSFKGGSPASAYYSVLSIPPKSASVTVVAQFDVTQLFKISK